MLLFELSLRPFYREEHCINLISSYSSKDTTPTYQLNVFVLSDSAPECMEMVVVESLTFSYRDQGYSFRSSRSWSHGVIVLGNFAQ